jgi:O-antigen biosynthesis protein WbqP
MKRIFDCGVVVLFGPFFFIIFIFIYILVLIVCGRPVLHWSSRVGRQNGLFNMPKFRTMRIGTPTVATHLLNDPQRYLTPIGGFLRRTSLDELPQLWSILKGDMSFVGPRPALYNQENLIVLRTQYGVQELVPGLTGWAQVNGRDELSIPDKVRLDAEYLHRQSFVFDLKILWITFLRVVRRQGVSH